MLPAVIFLLLERLLGEDEVDAADRLEYGLALLVRIDRCPAFLPDVQLVCAESDDQAAAVGGA